MEYFNGMFLPFVSGQGPTVKVNFAVCFLIDVVTGRVLIYYFDTCDL